MVWGEYNFIWKLEQTKRIWLVFWVVSVENEKIKIFFNAFTKV